MLGLVGWHLHYALRQGSVARPARVGREAQESAHREDRFNPVTVGADAGGLATGDAFAEVEDDLRELEAMNRCEESHHRRDPATADDRRNAAQASRTLPRGCACGDQSGEVPGERPFGHKQSYLTHRSL